MAGGSGRLGESIGMRGDRIEKAFALAWKAHKSPDKNYLLEKIPRGRPEEVIIGFPASGAVKDWYSGRPFGETKINLNLFPSLKSVGNSEAALVNEAFLQRFEDILFKSSLEAEVEEAMKKQKQIVFTGHSSGAPIAILATLWALDKYLTQKTHQRISPLCVTFGSPFVGNHIISHATRRENWSHCFLHFVMRYDIVPRVFLASLSSISDQRFEAISQFCNPKSKYFMVESTGRATVTSDFYMAVVTNAATVTSHAACKLMGNSTDATLETLASFVSLSPYRPFGTYIFCTENRKLIVIRNPDAVLQLMFFSAQLDTDTEAEAARVAYRSLREHVIYGTELRQALGMQNVVFLDQLEKVPWSIGDGSIGDAATIATALNDLGLSTRARLCLRAAAESEVRKFKNEDKINEKKAFIETKMKELEEYREKQECQKVGYYDSFKLQEHHDDFKANVKRLELAGVWDEIAEKLRRCDELPDEFEGNPEWVELGTRFRQLVEPLDIANYYRHSRHREAGPYMINNRPKRYIYTQRWLEHAERKAEEAVSESSFWGEVEDLISSNGSYEDVKERVVRLEVQIRKWTEKGELAKDVFLNGSTLVKWWKTLPEQHKQESCIRSLIPQ